MRSNIGWLRRIGSAVAVLVVAAVGGLTCGGDKGGIEVDLSDADAVVAGALEALSPVGQVVHLSGSIEEEGETRPLEMWIDAENELGRRETVHEGTLREVSVINGWDVASYNPWANTVDTQNMQGWVLPEGVTDNPVLLSVWYVWMIGSADEAAVVGEQEVRGHDAIVVDMTLVRQEPLGDQEPGTDKVTLTLDARSLLPIEEEWQFVSTAGEESPVAKVSYDQAEYLSPDDLPADLFSPQSLDALVTPE